MPTTTLSTSLLESVNIVLANLGETPVNSITGATPLQVSLALHTIEEVSADIQTKGWWFNQTTGGNFDTAASVTIHPSNTSDDWNPNIPEEARRYFTVRAARISQTRFIGSEELQKFTYNEELVSLAILQQAHVRNSNGALDFNSFPTELRGLGVDEVMFLQGNVEEKIGTLRLGAELANIEKTKAETVLTGKQGTLVDAQATDVAADTTLKGKQGSLVDAQAVDVAADTSLKEKQEDLVQAQTTDVGADTTLKGKQGDLTEAQKSNVQTDSVLKSQQALTELEETAKRAAEKTLVDATELKTDAETAMLSSQKVQLDEQTAIQVTAEKDYYDGVVAGTQPTYRDYAAEMRIMGIQENSVISGGEVAFQNMPAYKKVELIKDAEKLRTATATDTGTDTTELYEVNKIMRFIGESPVTALNENALASEAVRLLRDTDRELQGRGWYFNTFEDGESYPLPLESVPHKYLDYLSVRVAILLTELYPKSGVDIQRLPKMELELRAYFKDREFNDAQYTVFDNYDTASRIGINRNYTR